VNPAATAEATGQAAKTLVIGGDVIYNETITTGPAGQVQIPSSIARRSPSAPTRR